MNKPECWVKNPDGLFLVSDCFFQFPVHLLNPSLTVQLGWASADEQIIHILIHHRLSNHQLLAAAILGDRIRDARKGWISIPIPEVDKKANRAAGGIEEILGLERLAIIAISKRIKPDEFDQ
jgi:hypothetical protein